MKGRFQCNVPHGKDIFVLFFSFCVSVSMFVFLPVFLKWWILLSSWIVSIIKSYLTASHVGSTTIIQHRLKGDERILTSALRIPWQIVHELSLLYNPDNAAELHSALCCLEETLIPAYMHLVCSNYYKYVPMLLNFLCHLHLCSSIIHSEIVSVSTYI